MIDCLAAWVKVIAFMVLFATFLEFLLPNSNMQRFIRVILGLFIMLAILNPLVDWLHDKKAADPVTVIVQKSIDPSASLQYGQHFIQERDDLILEVYKSDIAKQAGALVMSLDGVAEAKIKVSLSNKDEGKEMRGKISKMEVFLRPNFDQNKDKVMAIKIKESSEDHNNNIPIALVGKIKNTLCGFYQLRDEQVDISIL